MIDLSALPSSDVDDVMARMLHDDPSIIRKIDDPVARADARARLNEYEDAHTDPALVDLLDRLSGGKGKARAEVYLRTLRDRADAVAAIDHTLQEINTVVNSRKRITTREELIDTAIAGLTELLNTKLPEAHIPPDLMTYVRNYATVSLGARTAQIRRVKSYSKFEADYYHREIVRQMNTLADLD